MTNLSLEHKFILPLVHLSIKQEGSLFVSFSSDDKPLYSMKTKISLIFNNQNYL